MRERDLDRIPNKRDWIVPIIIALVSLVLSGYVSYNQNDKTFSNRLSVVETQQKSDGQQLNRMEDKLDRLLERGK